MCHTLLIIFNPNVCLLFLPFRLFFVPLPKNPGMKKYREVKRTFKVRYHCLLVFACLLIGVMLSVPVDAQNDKKDYEYGVFSHFGAQIGLGTEGFTGGFGTTITPFFELGINVNYMPAINVSSNVKVVNSNYLGSGTVSDLGKVKISGDLGRLTFDAKLNVYPFGPGTTFFVAGGVSVGGKRLLTLSGHSDEVEALFDQYGDQIGDVAIVINESELSLSKTGDVEGDIRVNNVRPYVGLGFGRLVPKKGIGVRLEAGVQFTGKLKVYQGDKQINYESLLKSAEKEMTGDDRISKLVDHMRFYPVLKLTLTGAL